VNRWIIQSSFVSAEVQDLGAMLGPAWFTLGDRSVQPFAVAPWSNDGTAEHEKLPALLRRLRGEWPCIPYGIDRSADATLPASWRPRSTLIRLVDPHPHGYSSNARWGLAQSGQNSIELFLDYPEWHAVKRITRTIYASPKSPRLTMGLQIEARIPVELPIGLHPTFRLPDSPRRALLELAPECRAWTAPISLEPEIARFCSDARDVPLDNIPALHGSEDITRLPLPYPAEEILLVSGHRGWATLRNFDEHYAVSLKWDPKLFPSCQVWLSNRGRREYPWNGRFLALGIEPLRSAFDLGAVISCDHTNPLWRAGVPCSIALEPGRPLETQYEIFVTFCDTLPA
jgi:hypothetical protein